MSAIVLIMVLSMLSPHEYFAVPHSMRLAAASPDAHAKAYCVPAGRYETPTSIVVIAHEHLVEHALAPMLTHLVVNNMGESFGVQYDGNEYARIGWFWRRAFRENGEEWRTSFRRISVGGTGFWPDVLQLGYDPVFHQLFAILVDMDAWEGQRILAVVLAAESGEPLHWIDITQSIRASCPQLRQFNFIRAVPLLNCGAWCIQSVRPQQARGHSQYYDMQLSVLSEQFELLGDYICVLDAGVAATSPPGTDLLPRCWLGSGSATFEVMSRAAKAIQVNVFIKMNGDEKPEILFSAEGHVLEDQLPMHRVVPTCFGIDRKMW